ncbi:ZIP family metal transporter [Candidatus Daviesbacteria bacterium]|nr:ZIP family metal transporter [Candidatus Daviesbacteria bacterium]
MDTFTYILVFSFIGSVVSLVGGVLLIAKEKIATNISHFLASFAAGTLLGTAFFDLMPEAFEAEKEVNIFFWVLFGILTFFILEHFISWFHHHHEHSPKEKPSTVPLIIFGDSIHNFIDGVVIAATFLVNIPLGVITSLAVAAHEIPQEIGDFGVMLHRGIKPKKVLFWNFFSALTAMVGAVLTFFIKDSIEGLLPIVLAISAGFFIYIAASDLIPEIHSQDKRSVSFIQVCLLILGVLVVYFAVSLLEGSN